MVTLKRLSDVWYQSEEKPWLNMFCNKAMVGYICENQTNIDRVTGMTGGVVCAAVHCLYMYIQKVDPQPIQPPKVIRMTRVMYVFTTLDGAKKEEEG